jgi:hypothetical protein
MVCFQCNTTRRSRHIVRTRCCPPKMQQKSHYTRTHENPLLKTLLVREESRQLKRNWPIDLIWGTGDSPLEDSPSRHCNNPNISLWNVNSDCWPWRQLVGCLSISVFWLKLLLRVTKVHHSNICTVTDKLKLLQLSSPCPCDNKNSALKQATAIPLPQACKNRDSAVSIATGCELDDRGSEFESR